MIKKSTIILWSILILTSCGKKNELPQELEVVTTKITLHSGEKERIDAISDYPIVYESDDLFHASVSDEGMVTGVKVGTTEIIVSSNGEVHNVLLEVEPTLFTYETPLTEWGMSRDSIIILKGDPDREYDRAIAYDQDAPKVSGVIYVFNEEQTLRQTTVIIPAEHLSEVHLYLNERFHMLEGSNEDGVKIYINALELSEAKLLVLSNEDSQASVMTVNYVATGDVESKSKADSYSNIRGIITSIRKEK